MSNGKITERRIKLRKQLFPDLKDSDLWNRKTSDGFTTIPRTMPLILQIIDALTKSAPSGSTYFDLWCRCFDEYLVYLKNDHEMATAAGFSGQRSVYTWRSRIEALRQLGFILTQAGGIGRYTHAVLLNPYKILKGHKKRKSAGFPEDLWNALLVRVTEIGADDLNDGTV